MFQSSRFIWPCGLNIPRTSFQNILITLQIFRECALLQLDVPLLSLESRGTLLHSAVDLLVFKMRKMMQSKQISVNIYLINKCLIYIIYRLFELVEDCGPLPLANDKCKLDTEKTNKTASFPYCCPIFTCDPGVKLEYPEIGKDNDKKNSE